MVNIAPAAFCRVSLHLALNWGNKLTINCALSARWRRGHRQEWIKGHRVLVDWGFLSPNTFSYFIQEYPVFWMRAGWGCVMFSISALSTWQRQDMTRSPEAVIRHPSNESRAHLSQGTCVGCHRSLVLGLFVRQILLSRFQVSIPDPDWHQENCYKEEFWHKNMISRQPSDYETQRWKFLHNTQSDTKLSTGSQITPSGVCILASLKWFPRVVLIMLICGVLLQVPRVFGIISLPAVQSRSQTHRLGLDTTHQPAIHSSPRLLWPGLSLDTAISWN